MANCDNKPADSLVAGTFLGVDCDGNPVGAGGSIATCGNLQGTKDSLLNSIDEAVGEATQDINDRIDNEVETLNNRDDQLDAKIDKEIDDRIAADAALRDETKIKSIERTDDTVTVELMDGTKFSFSVADDECNDCGRAVDFDISEDGNSLDITLADGTKLDLTHKELTDWLASKDSALATDQELQDVYDALDAAKVSKDELCELVEPCMEGLLDNLPPAKFISEHTVDGNKLISTYNTGGTIEAELPPEKFISNQALDGNKLVSTYNTGGAIEVELPPEKFISEHTIDGNKLVSTYNTGGTIEVELPIPESSGLDCEAISELDEKGWEDGTTLLAQSGRGECYRLGNIASLFHDVGIGIGYSTSRQEVDKDVEFTYTVTNTGNNKVEAVDLAIVIPTEVTDYSFEIESVTPNGVDSYETIDDLNYSIIGMASGATFKVRAIVTGSESGTYQTSAQATTNSPFEQNIENNVATAIVNFYNSESNYIPTIDCPLIIATDVASGTELNTFGLGMENVSDLLGRANVYMTGESLAGKKIKLEGASTIISNCTVMSDFEVMNNRESGIGSSGASHSNVRISRADISTHTYAYSETAGRVLTDYVLTQKRVQSDTLDSPDGDGLVTFDQATQIATFADNPEIRAAVIFMRPAGQDCRWQAIYLVSTNSLPVDPSCRSVTKVSGNATVSWQYKTEGLNPDVSYYQTYPTNKYIGGTDPEDWIVTGGGGIKSILGKKQAVISHKEGTASVLKMVDTCGDAKNYVSSGAVATSWDEDTSTLTINIAASAKATDSQEWRLLKIDIS